MRSAAAWPAAGAAQGARVLIADDDRLVLATLTAGLDRLGYQVTPVSTREAALEAHAAREFDLALLDVRLGPDNGLELAQALRATRPVCVVFLSAFNDAPLVERAASEGGLAYVVKPITPEQLAPLLETVLARGRELQTLRSAEDALRDALARERQVSVAVGFVMERQRVSSREAFEILRRRARNERRRLGDIAAELVGAADRVNALAAGDPEEPSRS